MVVAAFFADGSYLLVGRMQWPWHLVVCWGRPIPGPMPLVDFSDRKSGGFGGVRECCATFLAAVVLDPWACTGGRFFDCGDEIEPKVWVEEESFGTLGGFIFGGFWRIEDTADLVGFWWMEDSMDARGIYRWWIGR